MQTDTSTLPPLRAATVWCVELRRGAPVRPETLAHVADVDPARARAYASILLAKKALVETDAGLVPGPAWDEWCRSPCGRPHRAAAAPQAAEAMDAMRRAMAQNIRAAAARMGLTRAELARRSGVNHRRMSELWLYADPLTAVELVLVARCLGATVEQLVAPPAPFRG
jgi:hypothetical protein